MANDVKRIRMLKHSLMHALMDAYPGLHDDPHWFLPFAVFNPDIPDGYIVPHNLIIPGDSHFMTLGVECEALLNPLVAFEWFGVESDFLSRWHKVEAYRAIPSLRQYIALIAREKPYAEQHTLIGDRWEIKVLSSPNDHVELVDRGKKLPLSVIFEHMQRPKTPTSMRMD